LEFRSVVGAGVDVSAVQARWEKFELALESHTLYVKEQVEVMKKGVEGRKDTLNQAVQKFSARWQALKPSDNAINEREQALKAICTFELCFYVSVS
jgi:hypothetical protein